MKRFLSPVVWVPALSTFLLGLTVAGAQVPRDAPRSVRIYEGVSNRGNLQDALDDAVSRGLRAMPGADRLIRYRVREISGQQGGIAGFNTVRVAIEVTGEEEPGPPRRPERPQPPEDTPPGDFTRSLRPELTLSDERVSRDRSVTLEFRVRNTTDRTVILPFASGQKYDFEVRRDDRTVWRWSRGRIFTQALTRTPLPPDETLRFREVWDLRDNNGNRVPPGDYTVRAVLAAGARPRVEATARLTVTE